MRSPRYAVAGSLFLLACLAAAAQERPARFGGHVENHAGAAVSNARIMVANGTVEVARTTTDAAGNFQFYAVPNTYLIEVSRTGFIGQRVSQTFRTDAVSGVFILQSVPPAAQLQRSRVADVARTSPWTYGALLQGGNGVTDNREGFHFLMVGGRAGKVLTPELGTGPLKGNFEYGVEVFPFWQSYTPKFSKVSCFQSTSSGVTTCSAPYTVGGTYTGASITPIMLRWNFTAGERWMPWLQGGGGVLWTNHKYPAVGSTASNLTDNGPNADTSVWNFTPQFGVGTHRMLAPGKSRGRSLDFSLTAMHISSASLGDKNPGVNVSLHASIGYSWWR